MNHLLAKHHAAKATICSINLMYLRSTLFGTMLMQQSKDIKHFKSSDKSFEDTEIVMMS
jgi:hypothetical protein